MNERRVQNRNLREIRHLPNPTQLEKILFMDGILLGKPLVATRITEVKTSAEPKPSLHNLQTPFLSGVGKSDPRLNALHEACALAESLKDDSQALIARAQVKGHQDPMTVAQGCNSLEKAMAEVEALIRKLDDALVMDSLNSVQEQARA